MTDSPWQPIAGAPRDGISIDILAKTWLRESDKFEYRRFPDCFWSFADLAWVGVDEEYLPVAWMPTPPIPEAYP